MTISDLCINRPVFTWVLVAIPVVLGLVSYNELGVDLFPNVDFPVCTVTTVLPGASVEEMETTVTQAGRRHHQHGLGHRRAAVDHPGRRVDRHRPVPAVQERRRGNAGGSRQGQHDPVRPARRHAAADRRQVRHRVDARDDHRGLGQARLSRGDRDRAASRSRSGSKPCAGVGAINLVGGRVRAMNVVVDTDKLAGLQPVGGRRSPGPGAAEPRGPRRPR